MGGYGSGRWGTGKPDAKRLVESCRELDVNLLVREGIIRPNSRRRGSWEWLDEDGAVVASVGFDVQSETESGTFRLSYSVVAKVGREREVQDYRIPLVTTCLPSGGRRWWFRCIARRGGPVCARRIGKIFLPRRGRIFACRHCHELTYESCRESSRGCRMWDSLGASVGIDGRQARNLFLRDGRRERRWRDATRQRSRIDRGGFDVTCLH